MIIFMIMFLIFILDISDLTKAVNTGLFGTNGKIVYFGEDPTSSYNLSIGKIVLLLWEYVDCLRSLNALGLDWCLTRFLTKKVSSSATCHLGFHVLLLDTMTLLTSLFRLSSLLCVIMSCIQMCQIVILYTILELTKNLALSMITYI